MNEEEYYRKLEALLTKLSLIELTKRTAVAKMPEVALVPWEATFKGGN